MRLPLIPALIFLLFCILIDVFIYRRMRQTKAPRRLCVVFAVVSALCLLALLSVTVLPKRSGSEGDLRAIMWVLYSFLTVYVAKALFVAVELVRMLLSRIFSRPLRAMTVAGVIAATGAFGLMWWGAVFNRFNIEVNEVEAVIPGLPKAFDGYRIVQISDLHTGSFNNDTTFVDRLVSRVNSLDPDIIVFTGDIVNRRSDELKPYTSTLSRLKARAGVYSIMGNHDYGDYYRWPSETARGENIASLHRMQHDMGWTMLNNSHVWLHAGNDSIALVGVENIGDPPFRTYGSLAAAYNSPSDNSIKILLSHNPAHWEDSIAGRRDMNFALTLSGHTHAMQIELFGISPAALRYQKWGGMYTDSLDRKLYVNIGAGEVGMPARIGATPEITLITLK